MMSNLMDREQAILGITSALGIDVGSLFFSPDRGEGIMVVDPDPGKKVRLLMVVITSREKSLSGGHRLENQFHQYNRLCGFSVPI